VLLKEDNRIVLAKSLPAKEIDVASKFNCRILHCGRLIEFIRLKGQLKEIRNKHPSRKSLQKELIKKISD
jgi:hypothetical protein